MLVAEMFFEHLDDYVEMRFNRPICLRSWASGFCRNNQGVNCAVR